MDSNLVKQIKAMGVTDPVVAHKMMDRYLKTGVLSAKLSDGNKMFKRIKAVGINRQGTGLWKELPEVTNDQVRRAFGTGLASQDKEKYSESIIIQSNETGIVYTLYKRFGEWRVGAGRYKPESDFELLCEMLKVESFA